MRLSSDESELRQQILVLLREKGNRVLAPRDIADRLEERVGHPLTTEEIEPVLRQLEKQGEILPVRGKRYSLLEFTPFKTGKIRVHPDGFGVVPTRDPRSPDIHIGRKSMRGAMHGDVVLVRVEKNPRERRKAFGKPQVEGEVTRVLQRENRTVVGRFHDYEPPFVRPFDVRLDSDIYIYEGATMNARDGEMVDVEIDQYPSGFGDPYGSVIEVLGMLGEPGVDIEVVIRKYRIPHQFPEDVLAAAETVPDRVPQEEIDRRTDLRDFDIVTIDGETAKDFDDAVEVRPLSGGRYLVGVHIADVAHYVTENSILDREAFERGTSVYFPGRAVPMLPERLSNGICSLNPHVDRLTFSVTVEIDEQGRLHDRKFFKSVIRTRERMTYTAVNAILTAPTPELEERYRPLLAHFRRMHDVFQILRQRRDSRGSIDFDLPEADVLLGEEGEIESIQPSSRNVAHRLIEEFMLLANEVVAQHLVFAAQPGIFRVHQPPDPQRLEDLKLILSEFKHKLRGNTEEIRPAELQRVLKEIAGTPEERFLTEIILRSMKRAIYLQECAGHFALGLQHYCHFTSPIRRYPDLIVHRRLQELLTGRPAQGEMLASLEALHPIVAAQSSDRERRAEEAEREVLEWKKVIFMRDKIGLAFPGRVTGVVPFGLFVELDEVFVQGLVPVASIGGDYWQFVEREHRLRGETSSREFRLGDAVGVEVKSIDEDRRQIEFRLVEAGGVPIARRTDKRDGR